VSQIFDYANKINQEQRVIRAVEWDGNIRFDCTLISRMGITADHIVWYIVLFTQKKEKPEATANLLWTMKSGG